MLLFCNFSFKCCFLFYILLLFCDGEGCWKWHNAINYRLILLLLTMETHLKACCSDLNHYVTPLGGNSVYVHLPNNNQVSVLLPGPTSGWWCRTCFGASAKPQFRIPSASALGVWLWFRAYLLQKAVLWPNWVCEAPTALSEWPKLIWNFKYGWQENNLKKKESENKSRKLPLVRDDV